MSDRLGLQMKLYRDTAFDPATFNPASPSAPTWVEVTNVRDLQRNFEKDRADMTTRAGNGWKQQRSTLKDGDSTWQMNYDTADAHYAALWSAFLNNTPVRLAFADGPIATSGTKYLEMYADVFRFGTTENLTEGVTTEVGVGPTSGYPAPAETTVA